LENVHEPEQTSEIILK